MLIRYLNGNEDGNGSFDGPKEVYNYFQYYILHQDKNIFYKSNLFDQQLPLKKVN